MRTEKTIKEQLERIERSAIFYDLYHYDAREERIQRAINKLNSAFEKYLELEASLYKEVYFEQRYNEVSMQISNAKLAGEKCIDMDISEENVSPTVKVKTWDNKNLTKRNFHYFFNHAYLDRIKDPIIVASLLSNSSKMFSPFSEQKQELLIKQWQVGDWYFIIQRMLKQTDYSALVICKDPQYMSPQWMVRIEW